MVLPRYSEDLDFSLDYPDADFNLSTYLSYVEKELRAYNFNMTVRKKERQSRVQFNLLLSRETRFRIY